MRLVSKSQHSLIKPLVCSLISLSLGGGSVLANQSYLPLSRAPISEDQLMLGVGASYLRTTSNFSASGEKVELNGSHRVEILEGKIFSAYGVNPKLSLFGDIGVTGNSVTAKPHDINGYTTNTNITISDTAAKDMLAGLRFQPESAPIRLSLEAFLRIPLHSRQGDTAYSLFSRTSKIPPGDGTTEMGVYARGEIPLSNSFYLGAGAGFTQRNQNFSDFIPTELFLKYEDPRTAFFRLGILAQFTASKDLYKDRTSSARANDLFGGSQHYNAVNPEFVKLDSAIGLYLSNTVFVSGGVQLEMTGSNTSYGPTWLAALGMDFDLKEKKVDDYEGSNRGFKQYYFEAQVIQANNQVRKVLINKGRIDGIKIGEFLDIFRPNPSLEQIGAAVARAKVIEAGPTRSKLLILEFFKIQKEDPDSNPVKEGFVVRRPVN